MEKKKLGLSGKTKLELSKTVRGGTVRQSFSHGRVKSVEVEVKRVRTFNKNSSSKINNTEENKTPLDINKIDDITAKTNKNKLQKLKEEAQNDRIARENKISSTDEKKPIEELVKENKAKIIGNNKTNLNSLDKNQNFEADKNVLVKEDEKNKKSGVKKIEQISKNNFL